MIIQPYQFIVAGLAVYMMGIGLHAYFTRQPGQTLLKLLVRVVVWGGMAAVALWPRLTNHLADVVGLEGNINAVILTGFILVFVLIFKMLSIIERIERDVTRITRQRTLETWKEDKQS